MPILNHLLSFTIFSPLLGVLAILFVPRRFEEGVRQIATAASALTLVLCGVAFKLTGNSSLISLQEKASWIPSLKINYHVGLDGAAALMFALTGLLTLVAIIASWSEIKTRRKEFYSLLLISEVGLLGVFASLDLFLFFVFWEAMLIPMYLIIGMFGSGERIKVAYKFLLFTAVGSVAMLSAIFYLFTCAGSFNLTELPTLALAPNMQLALFAAFAFAFAIKIPLVPLHTWLPDAHTEAPTAGSILLAGLFLKAGLWGFYRIAMPVFPHAVASSREILFILACVAIIYGAVTALAQTDLKRLIAYSSISHMGFVLLGFAALNKEGVTGGVLQMFNHGVSTGALFLIFGFIYARGHTRVIGEMGGYSKRIPLLSFAFIFAGLASIGLPGLNNFTGEFLSLVGAYKADRIYAIVAVSSVVIAAAYMLWAIERVFFGKAKSEVNLKDASATEIFTILPLVILIVWVGVAPNGLIKKIYPSVNNFVELSKREVHEADAKVQNIALPRIEFKPELIVPDNFSVDAPAGDDPRTKIYIPADEPYQSGDEQQETDTDDAEAGQNAYDEDDQNNEASQ